MREGVRRRPGDFRRPGRRRWFSRWSWLWWPWIVFGSVGLFLLLIVLFGPDTARRSETPAILQRSSMRRSITEGLNVTEEMLNPNSKTRQLVDQVSLAKILVVIAKESRNLQFAWELSTQIRQSQALLSSVATQQSSVREVASETAIREMALLLYQAQQFHYDGATMIMKLKGNIQALEESAGAEKEKSTKYGQIAAEELPKGLYCFGVCLTMEWYKNSNHYRKLAEGKRISEKLIDNTLYHYCVFSDNVLATSVVVNSTAINSHHPDKVVFHLVTDEVNYAAMKSWFSMNSFRGATVDIQKVEDFSWLNASYVPVLKQLQDSDTQNFYFSGGGDGKIPIKFRNPKYLSMLNHLRFYLPEVFPELEKVIFLDDDVVVQKDLTELFSIDLNGNVMGAVETCMETFHRFHKYLNYSHPLIRAHFDPDACGWAFGMNIVNLRVWRKRNVTGIYHYWQERNVDHTLWKLGSLPPGLLAFYGLVERLDPKWHVLGLGYSNVDLSVIRKGAVVHWNGNQKPWLKIANEKYKGIWDKYIDYSHPLLQRCYIH
uniref:Hexosyltransferase n=1 Tax=Anthurium amnicola TaxID=1678845 RepID=A0A1D1ZHX6_9ARAE